MSALSSSTYPMASNGSSSSGGTGGDADSLDSSDYPTVFLLAIFLPALAVGAVFLYFHYAMKHWGELRWPWNAPGGKRRRRIAALSQPVGGGVSLVAELRNELSGVSGIGPNDSFIMGGSSGMGSEPGSARDRPAGSLMHKPLLADNIF